MEDVFSKKFCKFSQDNVVSIVSKLEAGWPRVKILVAVRDFSSQEHPDKLWVSTSILSNGKRGAYPRGKGARA